MAVGFQSGTAEASFGVDIKEKRGGAGAYTPRYHRRCAETGGAGSSSGAGPADGQAQTAGSSIGEASNRTGRADSKGGAGETGNRAGDAYHWVGSPIEELVESASTNLNGSAGLEGERGHAGAASDRRNTVD